MSDFRIILFRFGQLVSIFQKGKHTERTCPKFHSGLTEGPEVASSASLASDEESVGADDKCSDCLGCRHDSGLLTPCLACLLTQPSSKWLPCLEQRQACQPCFQYLVGKLAPRFLMGRWTVKLVVRLHTLSFQPHNPESMYQVIISSLAPFYIGEI